MRFVVANETDQWPNASTRADQHYRRLAKGRAEVRIGLDEGFDGVAHG